MTQPLTSPRPSTAANATGEVRAHDRVVRYSRAGTAGPSLLLLAVDSSADLWPEFPRLLAERFRLVIPDLPADAAEAVTSFRGLLEGLGCASVDVIAAGRHIDAALALVLERHEGVGRVVVVPEEEGGTESPIQPGASNAVTAPIYVISRRLSVDEAIERVSAYLALAAPRARP